MKIRMIPILGLGVGAVMFLCGHFTECAAQGSLDQNYVTDSRLLLPKKVVQGARTSGERSDRHVTWTLRQSERLECRSLGCPGFVLLGVGF